jgi:branched-chain amino acid transport system substrate-binding protein
VATSGGAASGGAGPAQAAAGAPVAIGNVGEFSGVIGSMFAGAPAGIQAWAQTANAHGGLNGHPVKLISADDGSDPARGLSLVKQMVESQGAIALVGSMIPLSMPGIRPYLDQKGIPLIGGDNLTSDWSEDPLIFPVGLDVNSLAAAIVKLVVGAGHTKMAVLYCGEDPACKELANAKPPPGAQDVYVAQISIFQTDFTTECLQAKSRGADAIVVAADPNSVSRVARACAQQQYKPAITTGGLAVGPQLAADPNLNGLVAPVQNAPWFLSTTPATKQFNDAMRLYQPGATLSAASASTFYAGMLVQAASSHFSAHPTSQELIRGLDGLHNETLGGAAPPLTFTAGKGSGPIPCYFVVAVQNGHWIAPNGASPQCL